MILGEFAAVGLKKHEAHFPIREGKLICPQFIEPTTSEVF
jgi:hypothetical protein